VDGGTVVGAIVLDIMDGSIVGVRVVRNPDKLRRLSGRLSAGAFATDEPVRPG
jgi:hypothetical protein